jgi:hypothetical protein
MVEHAPAGMRQTRGRLLALALGLAASGCMVEGGSLAISAGAPVTAALEGRITRCAEPVPGAEVVVLMQQAQPGQARPVNARIGPVTTTRDGRYLIELSPAFAVPGAASVQLRVTSDGTVEDIPGRTLELRLGVPASDTTRFDADLGVEQRQC